MSSEEKLLCLYELLNIKERFKDLSCGDSEVFFKTDFKRVLEGLSEESKDRMLRVVEQLTGEQVLYLTRIEVCKEMKGNESYS